MYEYNFKEENLTKRNSIKLKNATRLSSNHKNLIGIINDNSFSLHILKNNTLKQINSITKKINQTINQDTLITLNIAPNNSIAIVGKENIYFFSKRGKLLNKIKNKLQLNIIDSTSYSDFILSSQKTTKVTKYTNKGEFLFNQELAEIKKPLVNINIYKPYGDFVAFNENEGAYYSMKTSINIQSCSEIEKKNTLEINCTVKLSFPASIKSKVSNKNGDHHALTEYNLKSGTHKLTWKNIPLEFKDSSIEFLTKGLYSNQNILKNKYKINVKD